VVGVFTRKDVLAFTDILLATKANGTRVYSLVARVKIQSIIRLIKNLYYTFAVSRRKKLEKLKLSACSHSYLCRACAFLSI
jgi:hypothetical protein